MYPADLGPEALTDLEAQPEEMCRGGSAIISPLGEYLAGPLYGEEGILYADLDLAAIAGAKFDFDPVGHYARPDVLRLNVDTEPRQAVRFGPDPVPPLELTESTEPSPPVREHEA